MKNTSLQDAQNSINYHKIRNDFINERLRILLLENGFFDEFNDDNIKRWLEASEHRVNIETKKITSKTKDINGLHEETEEVTINLSKIVGQKVLSLNFNI